ncbi:MAG: hypothetical protein QN189_06750 [Armatimonadota bacterium]|nr:hypothetical protein [Armatimonadota bacterium]
MQSTDRVLACFDEEIPRANPPGCLGFIAAYVRGERCAQGLQIEVAEDACQGWERPNVLAIGDGEHTEWGVLFSANTDLVLVYDLLIYRRDPFPTEVFDSMLFGQGAAGCKLAWCR